MKTRRFAVLMALVGSGLVMGCGGGGSAPPVNKRMTITNRSIPGTVVFHMTGLLLIVPPRSLGEPMDILLPDAPGHVALLGFGIEPGNPPGPPGFCRTAGFAKPPIRHGICYVDLSVWQLEAFGLEGNPAPDSTHPRDVLNVTTLSGGYKVEVPEGRTARRRIRFLTGEYGKPCGLAVWKYRPVTMDGRSQAEQSMRPVNVLEWRVSNVYQPKFVFRKGEEVETVELPFVISGIDVVLAHVPEASLVELPPQANSVDPGPLDTVSHFPAFYQLLNKPTTVPPSNRASPYDGVDENRRCDVSITLFSPQKSKEKKADASPRTFSCMVATADRF